jgi:PAS domain S-box-containing protein
VEKNGDPRSPTAGSTFEQLLEAAPDAMIGVDSGGLIVFVNSRVEALFGYGREDLLGEGIEKLIPERFAAVHPGLRDGYFAEPRMRPMAVGIALFGRRRDRSEFPAEILLSSIETAEGRLATAAVRDVSDRAESERERVLQRQLDRARRLESVGQLAGGIAHDFNNILAVILNYAEFAAESLEEDSPARADIKEVQKAAERAAALTRQLLIFSRREVAKPEVLYLRDVIADLENLLSRALGERVALETHFGEERLPIEIDPGQLEQVLVNLAVNARDAMADGGRLIVEVEPVHLDQEYTQLHPDLTPGPYVRLKVSDTGEGMERDVAERIFEPFFTTKQDGTGLGLATVYGIVTGAGGRIDVYSEPGIGTTMKIHLPASDAEPAPASSGDGERPRGRGERIIVVEDEPGVRKITERILLGADYDVTGTDRGQEAMAMCADRDRPIDLLLTDVVMPEMLGTELVAAARGTRPDLRVLFMSGYSHAVLAPEALADEEDSSFIEKPFNAGELLRAVRDLLEGPGRAPSDDR